MGMCFALDEEGDRALNELLELVVWLWTSILVRLCEQKSGERWLCEFCLQAKSTGATDSCHPIAHLVQLTSVVFLRWCTCTCMS